MNLSQILLSLLCLMLFDVTLRIFSMKSTFILLHPRHDYD